VSASIAPPPAAHSSSTLPLASNVKFTENGKVMTLGEGLWRTAGAARHSQSALDVEICSSGTHAVVPEGNMDIPVALRLKLQNGLITEIETIAVRPGDYKLSGQTFASNTAAIISANSTVMWETAPTGQKATRAELTAWIDKYFRVFPMGVCNVASSCRRLENGYSPGACSVGATLGAGRQRLPSDDTTASAPSEVPFRSVTSRMRRSDSRMKRSQSGTAAAGPAAAGQH